MKAVLLTGHGGPEKLEYREDVPVPEPGASEVLVRVSAAGVNNTNIWTREGAYGSENNPQSTGGWRREPMEFPRIQGLDIVGCVERVGANAGAIAGPVVRLDLRTLYLKHLELIGSTMGTREEFAELVDLLEEDKSKPLLAGTYSLSEIKRAQEDFKKKDIFGKLVLVPR